MNKKKFFNLYIIDIMCVLMLFTMLVSCENYEDSNTTSKIMQGATNSSVFSQVEETSESLQTTDQPSSRIPQLIVNTVSSCIPGDKDVVVTIEIRNNPCLLGLDFDVCYNDTAMSLTHAESLVQAEGGHFTEPAYYRNPTTFLWDFQDSTWKDDGIILTLYFDIAESVAVGKYPVEIRCSYGNAFDQNGSPVQIAIQNAVVEIENKNVEY